MTNANNFKYQISKKCVRLFQGSVAHFIPLIYCANAEQVENYLNKVLKQILDFGKVIHLL